MLRRVMLRRVPLWAGLVLAALPALAAPPTLDGSNSVATGGGSAGAGTVGSVAAALTTSNPNDVVIVATFNENSDTSPGPPTRTVSSVTSATLTFQKLTSITQSYQAQTGPDFYVAQDIEVWWAQAPLALSAESITVTLNANTCHLHAHMFGVAGINSIGSPFDANVSLPATDASTTARPAVTISTSSTNDMLLWMAGGQSPSFISGNPFDWIPIDDTLLASGCLDTTSFTSAYKAVVATQSGLGITPLTDTGAGVAIVAVPTAGVSVGGSAVRGGLIMRAPLAHW